MQLMRTLPLRLVHSVDRSCWLRRNGSTPLLISAASGSYDVIDELLEVSDLEVRSCADTDCHFSRRGPSAHAKADARATDSRVFTDVQVNIPNKSRASVFHEMLTHWPNDASQKLQGRLISLFDKLKRKGGHVRFHGSSGDTPLHQVRGNACLTLVVSYSASVDLSTFRRL